MKPIVENIQYSSYVNPKRRVKIFCRVRCVGNPFDYAKCLSITPPHYLMISSPLYSRFHKDLLCKFEQVYPEKSSIPEIHHEVLIPLLSRFMKGENVLFFNYGGIRSGKNYTLNGTDTELGLLQQAIVTIFSSLKNHTMREKHVIPDRNNSYDIEDYAISETKWKIWDNIFVPYDTKPSKCYKDVELKVETVPITASTIQNEKDGYACFLSCYEIRDNKIYDLLKDQTKTKNFQTKFLKRDAHRNVYAHGLGEVEAKTPDQMFYLMDFARRTKVYLDKRLGGKSHVIFKIRLARVWLDQSKYFLKISEFNFVDLPECDRPDISEDLFKDRNYINWSLTCLKNCLDILRDNQISGFKDLIPYEKTCLTYVFQSFFDGCGSVAMMTYLNPKEEYFEENLRAVSFIPLVKDLADEIKIERKTNLPLSPEKELMVYKRPNFSVDDFYAALEIPALDIISFENEVRGALILDNFMCCMRKRAMKILDMFEHLESTQKHLRESLLITNQNQKLLESQLVNANIQIEENENKIRETETERANLMEGCLVQNRRNEKLSKEFMLMEYKNRAQEGDIVLLKKQVKELRCQLGRVNAERDALRLELQQNPEEESDAQKDPEEEDHVQKAPEGRGEAQKDDAQKDPEEADDMLKTPAERDQVQKGDTQKDPEEKHHVQKAPEGRGKAQKGDAQKDPEEEHHVQKAPGGRGEVQIGDAQKDPEKEDHVQKAPEGRGEAQKGDAQKDLEEEHHVQKAPGGRGEVQIGDAQKDPEEEDHVQKAPEGRGEVQKGDAQKDPEEEDAVQKAPEESGKVQKNPEEEIDVQKASEERGEAQKGPEEEMAVQKGLEEKDDVQILSEEERDVEESPEKSYEEIERPFGLNESIEIVSFPVSPQHTIKPDQHVINSLSKDKSVRPQDFPVGPVTNITSDDSLPDLIEDLLTPEKSRSRSPNFLPKIPDDNLSLSPRDK